MTSSRSVSFLIVLAFTLFSGSGVNAQNSAIDCQAQNLDPDCTTAQTHASSVDLPKVTYLNGQLTVTARNASLGDVLRAVSTQTGAVIEFPADRAGERISAQAGPGPVRDVLARLFNGSRFNYVILGSPTSPMQRMILTNAATPAASAPSELSSLPPVPPQQTASAAGGENSNVAVPALPAVPTAPTPPAQKVADREPAKGGPSLQDIRQMVKDNKISLETAKQMWRDQRAAQQQEQSQEQPQEPNPPQ
jgi:hypothetical protein